MKSIFEDTIRVNEVNSGQFNRVKRIEGKSDIYDLKIELDVNTEIYPIEKGKTLYFSLAKNINEGDMDVKDLYNPEDATEESMFDNYEYVMYGKIFECRPVDKDKMIVYISFGGLLMSLSGSTTHLRQLQYDSRLYLMMKNA